MSIATTRRTVTVSPLRETIASPLHKLKRAIRTYVLLEGLALALTWAFAWLWVTFAIDYGLFRLLGVDYIRDGSNTARVILRGLFTITLWGGLAYIVGYKVLYRLLATFNEPALALVFERRFPEMLGDRLVTAVELADPKMAETYGFSQPMIEDTTQAAAERVEALPLKDVFNRGRLTSWLALAGALLLSVICFGYWATDESAIWAERDLLLSDVYWPRRTILELPEFADGDTKAVPHGGDLKVTIRAWKWVVATKRNKEGWEPLEWSHLLGTNKHSERPWELKGQVVDPVVHDALPHTWTLMTLDQLEARIEDATRHGGPEAQARLAELGHALIDFVLSQTGVAKVEIVLDPRSVPESRELPTAVLGLLPERWRQLPPRPAPIIQDGSSSTLFYGEPAESIAGHLQAAKRLTPAEIKRLTLIISGQAICDADATQELAVSLMPFRPPMLSVGLAQRVVATHPLCLSDRDRLLLPPGSSGLPVKKLLAHLAEFPDTHSPEAIAEGMRLALRALFDELDARADQSHAGRRRSFRRLDVPKEVTVEFEQIQTDEEKARGKGKRATPRVKRTPGTNDYVYEFKKIDRPLRFRVVAGDDATPWYTINVKPLPVLTSLTRTQSELGYLHGSNDRVQTGPTPVSVEGSESKFDVPAGTRLVLEATTSKPLQWVRLATPQANAVVEQSKNIASALATPIGGVPLGGPSDGSNPLIQSLEHSAGSAEFRITLRELADQDVRLDLEFEDMDGILGKRRIAIGVLADKEPEFPRVGFEIVNRKMITNQAVIPFSGHIRDDQGLLALTYEVSLERPDRTIVLTKRFPFRRFSPLVVPESARAGLRFDRREHVSVARMFSTPLAEGRVGDAWFAPLLLGRLPATGYIGLAQFPAVDIAREYVFDHRPRPGASPVLDIGDEFFDTLALRADRQKPLEIDGQPLRVPYRVLIRLLATDNRVQSGANNTTVAANQESQSPETFEFNVVAEEDLLIEAGKREENLHDTTEEVITGLKKQDDLLKKLTAEFPSLKPEEFRRVAADVGDLLKAVREEKVRLDVEVAREFRQIYRELVLNRVTEQVLTRIDGRICRPLEGLVQPGAEFARTDEALDRLGRIIEAEQARTPKDALTTADRELANLIQQLEDIAKEMKRLMEFNRAIEVLRDIIKNQADINKILEDKWKKDRERELGDKP